MSDHDFPKGLSRWSSAACANGCGTIARQVRYATGVGDVEYFVGLEKTGPRAHHVEGVWTFNAPPCKERAGS